MVLRFSISSMIYIFDYPSPSHQFPQSQIAGSRTYVGHWSSPSVSTNFPISEFLNHIFLSLTFPISLSDFTIEL